MAAWTRAGELFGTETMAELCARQGRLDDALVIYRRLCAQAGRRRTSRALERSPARARGAAPGGVRRPRRAERSGLGARPLAPRAPAAAAEPGANAHALPLVVRQTVRSGQIVYAQGNDLIVLAPVNPGAQLLADGNIHVYAPLRGRAVAGARGAREARIFCQRLEAELVGIDTATVTAESLPAERFGKPAQISFEAGRCLVAPL